MRDTTAIVTQIILRGWAAWNVPMLAAMKPKVKALNQDLCTIVVAKRRATKNHMGSMYMGALVAGADAVSGLLAYYHAFLAGKAIDFVFKSADAKFLRRADGDTTFSCNQGSAVQAMIAKAIATGQREELSVAVTAHCKEMLVAEFTMVMSFKPSKIQKKPGMLWENLRSRAR
jgi:hypothetical protein